MAAIDILKLRTQYYSNRPNGVLTIYDNQPEIEPEPGRAFIRFSVRPGASNRETLGQHGIERMLGRVYCAVFVPHQFGDEMAHQLADECAAIFRQWRWTDGDDSIICGTPDLQIIDNDADWFQVKVSHLFESRHRY